MLRAAMNVDINEKVDEVPNYEEALGNEKSNTEEEVNADETESNRDVINLKKFFFLNNLIIIFYFILA